LIRSLVVLALLPGTISAHEELRYSFVQGERVEYRDSQGDVLWDMQGWHGGDYHKLWIKTEGHIGDGSIDDAEIQVLYSRAWTAFFDLQFGMRLSEIDNGDLLSGVVGVQGMAPYRFEIDAALFLSEDGDARIKAEFERDILLSEQLVLQPRAELDLAFQDTPELGIGSGLSELDVGLRLRYEVSRKFAPYIGIEWEKSFGETADFIRAAGEDPDEFSAIAGIRFWF